MLRKEYFFSQQNFLVVETNTQKNNKIRRKKQIGKRNFRRKKNQSSALAGR